MLKIKHFFKQIGEVGRFIRRVYVFLASKGLKQDQHDTQVEPMCGLGSGYKAQLLTKLQAKSLCNTIHSIIPNYANNV